MIPSCIITPEDIQDTTDDTDLSLEISTEIGLSEGEVSYETFFQLAMDVFQTDS